jgi:hypothetical protein
VIVLLRVAAAIDPRTGSSAVRERNESLLIVFDDDDDDDSFGSIECGGRVDMDLITTGRSAAQRTHLDELTAELRSLHFEADNNLLAITDSLQRVVFLRSVDSCRRCSRVLAARQSIRFQPLLMLMQQQSSVVRRRSVVCLFRLANTEFLFNNVVVRMKTGSVGGRTARRVAAVAIGQLFRCSFVSPV